MNLTDLTPSISSNKMESIYRNQFSKQIAISTLPLKESANMLTKVRKLIKEFTKSSSIHVAENNPTYLRLKMVEESAIKRINEFAEIYNKEKKHMKKNLFTEALKKVVSGDKLTENAIIRYAPTYKLRDTLRSQKLATAFMRKIVETKKRSIKLIEGEVDSAQTTLAAQDIVDQVQQMIEKMSDVQYKQLPALQDSIRSTHGVDEAEQFNTAVLSSIQELTGNLESAKTQLTSAVNVLTGESSGESDLDMDSLDGVDDDSLELDDMELDGDDLDDDSAEGDFDIDFEEEPSMELQNLGREKR